MSAGRRPPTAIVGAGRLAHALAPAARRAGYPIVAVASATVASARRLARRLPGAHPTTLAEEAVAPARLILLAVPDGEIGSVARRLAARIPGDWSRRTVLHHAGSMGTAPLAAVARLGAAVGVLHPMQCLGSQAIATSLLAGSGARIEGDRRGREAARRLARDLGLRVLALRARPTPRDRIVYHTASSLVSNDLVALLSLAVEALESLGIPHHEARHALLGLARGTLAQVEVGGIAAAITGPVARGDRKTAAAQLRVLARRSRIGGEVHRHLALRLLELVERGGGLDPERRDALRHVLGRAARGRRPRAGV